MTKNKALPFNEKHYESILDSNTIRARAGMFLDLAKKEKTSFKLDLSKLPELSKFVFDLSKERYPDFNVPFHSRLRHLEIIGDEFKKFWKSLDIQSQLDLVFVSVLLDAGAGNDWSYSFAGKRYIRSEGLAVASFVMFRDGLFSSDSSKPHQVDAEGLKRLQLNVFKNGFQMSPTNPLVGVEGRLQLLKSLGGELSKERSDNPCLPREQKVFGRLGNLWEVLNKNKINSAPEILKVLLKNFNSIWPARLQMEQGSTALPLGDVWSHPLLGKENSFESLMPFHKLSQWLCYSLLEVLHLGGFAFTGVEKLTGLAEYRNGGLFVDSGVLLPRDLSALEKVHTVDSEFIVEWRALTLALLDLLAVEFRKIAKQSEQELPLVKILEGGTWQAGRKFAFKKRPNGSGPFQIQSDGTVF